MLAAHFIVARLSRFVDLVALASKTYQKSRTLSRGEREDSIRPAVIKSTASAVSLQGLLSRDQVGHKRGLPDDQQVCFEYMNIICFAGFHLSHHRHELKEKTCSNSLRLFVRRCQRATKVVLAGGNCHASSMLPNRDTYNK